VATEGNTTTEKEMRHQRQEPKESNNDNESNKNKANSDSPITNPVCFFPDLLKEVIFGMKF
jgi:hypothetical protein